MSVRVFFLICVLFVLISGEWVCSEASAAEECEFYAVHGGCWYNIEKQIWCLEYFWGEHTSGCGAAKVDVDRRESGTQTWTTIEWNTSSGHMDCPDWEDGPFDYRFRMTCSDRGCPTDTFYVYNQICPAE